MSTVRIRYSKDGGRNWSGWRNLGLGETGDFLKRLRQYRFGQGIQWVFEIAVSDPVRVDLLGASVKT